ncbi:MAG: hypothetical protein AB7T08_11130 [Hyphomonadaceae bacterium]
MKKKAIGGRGGGTKGDRWDGERLLCFSSRKSGLDLAALSRAVHVEIAV